MRRRYPFTLLQVSPSRLAIVVVSASLLSGHGLRVALAQNNDLVPNENLASDGLPKVPASLAREVEPYTRLSAYSLAGWDPAKRELWIKSLASNSSSVFRVQKPGDALQREILIPTGVYDIYFEPQGRSLVYVKDTDGTDVCLQRNLPLPTTFLCQLR